MVNNHIIGYGHDICWDCGGPYPCKSIECYREYRMDEDDYEDDDDYD